MRTRSILRISATAAAAFVLAIAVAIPAHAQTTYSMLVAFAAGQVITVETSIEKLIQEIDKASNNSIKFKRSGPEVVPGFEQLEPVSKGAFDTLYTVPAYHAGATSIGLMLDAIDPNPVRRRATGIWDWIDNHYQKKANVKVLSMGAGSPYHILLREPISADGDLKGMKIRSIPTYDELIKTFGGVPVTLPVPQVFTGLEKGLVDGTAFPVHSMMTRKFNTVVRYMVRPTFGSAANMWVMNLDKWNGLDAKTKKIMLDAGAALEVSIRWKTTRIQLEDEQAMIQDGAKFTFLNDANAERLAELFNEGIYARAISVSGDAAKELVKMIKDNNMGSD